MQQRDFVFSLTRQEYEKKFGARYQRPGFFARVFAVLYKLVPKIGPFQVLSFKPPTAEVEKLFLESFQQARDRFRQSLDAIRAQRAGRLNLPNTDFDTGRPSVRGEYPLADDTYAELLDKLAERKFAGVPVELRNTITRYYGTVDPPQPQSRRERKRDARSRDALAGLIAASTTAPRR